jgi:predicted lysophospholipase L1 biosynthesis ABC-type transport system permease subunit
MTPDLLQLDPLALVILGASGIGVIYVVRIFTQAQTVREREMWAGMQKMSDNNREINNDWLKTYKEQGDKSSDSIQNLSKNMAALTTQVAHLTAAVEKSNESGANLQGASSLMIKVLQDAGNGRRGTAK